MPRHVEGKFFVWTPDEIWELLGSEADAFVAAYGVTCHDNLEGKNILEFVREMEQLPALAEARHKLYDVREERIQPGRDEKVLKMADCYARGNRAKPSSMATWRTISTSSRA